MSHVLHRDLRTALPAAVRGEGCYVIDSEGRRYLDASCGAAVSCLGHDDPRVIAAIKAQLDQIPYAHTSFFTTPAAEELADWLVDRAPGDLAHVCLVSGGSEAIEAALKLTRQYFLECGAPDRGAVIARRQSYHGATLGALAVSGNVARRAAYAPLLFPVTHVSNCYPYRDQRPDETGDAYGARLAQELDDTIVGLGPGRVAAFVAETVAGATLGAVPPPPGYFERVRRICDRHGVLLILDEVMCGMGRTGTLHAFEQEGVAPDLLVVAKGLGAGYQPIGAVVASARVGEALTSGSGALLHGHTYMGHPVACAAALAVQRVIESEGLLANVRHQGEVLLSLLASRFGDHPHVGDIRGRGLFLALELVRDRATKAPFEPVDRVHARVKQEALARGLICYPMGGTIDGARGDHILLAPPFIIDEAICHVIVDTLADALGAALP